MRGDFLWKPRKNKPLFGGFLLRYAAFAATLKAGAAIPMERRMGNAHSYKTRYFVCAA